MAKKKETTEPAAEQAEGERAQCPYCSIYFATEAEVKKHAAEEH